MKEYRRPNKTLPRSQGHHRDWIDACKGSKPASANFDYTGPLTEMVPLGNVAQRVGEKILWDGSNLEVTNIPEANNYGYCAGSGCMEGDQRPSSTTSLQKSILP